MEKILLAIDATNPSVNSLDFACYLGRLTKSAVTGIFLDNLAEAKTPVDQHAHMATEPANEMEQYAVAARRMETNRTLFRDGCVNREVNYAIHRDHGVPATEIINESRYADVLVTDAETSFQQHFEGPPTIFVKELLKQAECPVIIAPQVFESIDEIAFAYNGSASCMFAMKQFTYLFPQFAHLKTNIVMASSNGIWEDARKHTLVEWLKAHYTNLHYEILQGKGDTVLFDYLFKRKKTLVVLGAYGRSALSQFLKPSTADLLIKTLTQPIFITHV